MKNVDVGKKKDTERKASAIGRLFTKPEVIKLIREGKIEKGDVVTVSETVGMLGVKMVPQILPFCHPLLITNIEFETTLFDEGVIEVKGTVKNVGKTGVEIEAITGVTFALLNMYDMIKRVDRWVSIGDIKLMEKSGGKSGHVKRDYEYEGVVLQVAKSEKRGLKEKMEEIKLIKDFGVEGDVHGGSEREVSIFPIECIKKVPEEIRRAINPFDMTENIMIMGIPPFLLKEGKKLRIGEAEILIIKIGKEKFVNEGKPYIVSREGRFGKVISGGRVRIGDRVILI